METEELKGWPARRVKLAMHAQVSWFDVRQLAATAVQTLASTIVGSMTGRRELMAALEPEAGCLDGMASRDEVWLDYVADCGDGWNASASVAWLVGRDAVRLSSNGQPTPQPISDDCRKEAELAAGEDMLLLPAGRTLLLGGDQIYPTASAAGYQERLVGPLESARYFEAGGRDVLAIPGNHDWYDGLTGFIRLFCQPESARRWLGAWRTQQRRSYFAARLPHGWWLWGLDLALEDDFDPQQQEYFRKWAEQLQRGDRVILAVPTPVWLHKEKPDPDNRKEYGKLGVVMRLAMARGGIEIPLILTGDSHFYSHHRDTKRDYIVCGGGGAFTLGTTQVPEKVERADKRESRLMALFPDRRDSARLRWGALKFPWVNRAFSMALAFGQMLGIWVLGSALPPLEVGDWRQMLAGLGRQLPQMLSSPAVLLWAGVLLFGFVQLGRSGAREGGPKWPATLVGGVHGLLYVGSAVLAYALYQGLEAMWPSAWASWLLTLAVFALLSVVSGVFFGVYLALTHWLFGMHNQEAYSAQGIEDWKSFLRIHIRRDGATVYPVGLRHSARAWVPAPGVKERRSARAPLVVHKTMNVPAGCKRIMDPTQPLAPQLIEPPFVCGARPKR